MDKEFDQSLFIFHRDLRLEDNTTLIHALERSSTVIPIFIFDPGLLDKSRPNHHAIEFMVQSLDNLQDLLNGKLTYLRGKPHTVINKLLSSRNFDAIYINLDYTPYAIRRSRLIEKLVKQYPTEYFQYPDSVLINPEGIRTKTGSRYKVFTPFFKVVTHFKVKDVRSNEFTNYDSLKDGDTLDDVPIELRNLHNPDLYSSGGRVEALNLLKEIPQHADYNETRNFPSIKGTTSLSAHLKFGTISIREVYHAILQQFGIEHPLIRQLYWRDFYVYLGVHFPRIFTGAFLTKYNGIKWENNKDWFHKWKEGTTGFPIVDAGMRQLNTTGYMHNRVRMIVASFLVKDLHIDWKWGERYFAEKLLDYDTIVNNGNWQWAASTGADAQPYFRIFNPWTQQKKFDKDCIYIHRWVPELRDLPANAIHKLFEQRPLDDIDYPHPLVDHKVQAAKAKELFKQMS